MSLNCFDNDFTLSIDAIKEIPFERYCKDFTFVVNGKEYPTSRIIADILSPKIRQYHHIDETNNTFYINTIDKNTKFDFKDILSLITFQNRSLKQEELDNYLDIFSSLGNKKEFLKLFPKQPGEITTQNVINRIRKKQKYFQNFSSKKDDKNRNTFNSNRQETIQAAEREFLQPELDYISTHFSEIDQKEIQKLEPTLITEIMKSDKLQLEDEDSLLRLVNALYASCHEFSHLYEYVDFLNVSCSELCHFFDVFELDDISGQIWRAIAARATRPGHSWPHSEGETHEVKSKRRLIERMRRSGREEEEGGARGGCCGGGGESEALCEEASQLQLSPAIRGDAAVELESEAGSEEESGTRVRQSDAGDSEELLEKSNGERGRRNQQLCLERRDESLEEQRDSQQLIGVSGGDSQFAPKPAAKNADKETAANTSARHSQSPFSKEEEQEPATKPQQQVQQHSTQSTRESSAEKPSHHKAREQLTQPSKITSQTVSKPSSPQSLSLPPHLQQHSVTSQPPLASTSSRTVTSLPIRDREEFAGIIAYLTRKTGGNIHENGTITVTADNFFSPPQNLLDFDCERYFQAGGASSSVLFDFRGLRVQVAAYAIRSNSGGENMYHMRSWALDVSEDGEAWLTVDERRDDPRLNASYAAATFEVRERSGFARYVRLRQTDSPWGGGFLWFYYIEFYGDLEE